MRRLYYAYVVFVCRFANATERMINKSPLQCRFIVYLLISICSILFVCVYLRLHVLLLYVLCSRLRSQPAHCGEVLPLGVVSADEWFEPWAVLDYGSERSGFLTMEVLSHYREVFNNSSRVLALRASVRWKFLRAIKNMLLALVKHSRQGLKAKNWARMGAISNSSC